MSAGGKDDSGGGGAADPRTGAAGPPVITAAQCRAARALLDWTMPRVARAASVRIDDMRRFERSADSLSQEHVSAVRHCFECAGIVFIDDPDRGTGVCLGTGGRAKPPPARSRTND